MRKLLLPAIALGFSMLPLASGPASANAVSAPALAAAIGQSAGISQVHWRHYGYWRGPYGHRYGYWHRPYWHRYGYYRPYWRRYGYYRPYWRG